MSSLTATALPPPICLNVLVCSRRSTQRTGTGARADRGARGHAVLRARRTPSPRSRFLRTTARALFELAPRSAGRCYPTAGAIQRVKVSPSESTRLEVEHMVCVTGTRASLAENDGEVMRPSP